LILLRITARVPPLAAFSGRSDAGSGATMIVAFHSNQICLRGTEVALFDYAHFNETLLGNRSIVLAKNNKVSIEDRAKGNHPLALDKFRSRFLLYLYNDVPEIDLILDRHHADVFYAIKKGLSDGIESRKRKTVVHAVFRHYEPHGDVYAYNSKWLSDCMTGGAAPYVAHMINLPRVKGDLRERLRIPRDATVFARYGGRNSFNLAFVHHTTARVVKDHPKIYFLFMNTDRFVVHNNVYLRLLGKLNKIFGWKRNNRQIIFLPGSADMCEKALFINSADAMVHASRRGETFGLAIGEFAAYNKPIITYSGKFGQGHEKYGRAHLEILGSKCFLYDDSDQLERIFADIHRNKEKLQRENWDTYTSLFAPETVMNKFREVFLT
jgi:hypothetical protein